MIKPIRFAWLSGLLCALALQGAAVHADASLDAVLAGPQRSAANRARDAYRHPAETLAFFGITPTMTVVEIAPGAGWYTEILAPWLRDTGKLYAAHYSTSAKSEYMRRSATAFRARLAAEPAVYDRVEVTEFMPPEMLAIAPDGAADAVLTFRNVHNWLRDGGELKLMQAAFRALRPGGVFGVVEHRARPGTTREQSLESGYTAEQLVIDAALKAGFVLEAQSEVNANPRDTTDHPEGVWTLPPTLALGDADRAKYVAIGESDRMTLRFRKPAP